MVKGIETSFLASLVFHAAKTFRRLYSPLLVVQIVCKEYKLELIHFTIEIEIGQSILYAMA